MNDRRPLNDDLEYAVRAWGDAELGAPPPAATVLRGIDMTPHTPAKEGQHMAPPPQAARVHAIRRRGVPVAAALLVALVSVLLFTNLAHRASPGGVPPLGDVTVQQAWGKTGITSFPFDTQRNAYGIMAITPDGQQLIVQQRQILCPDPCPGGTDLTGLGISTLDIARQTLKSWYLQSGVPEGVSTDGRYVGFWRGIPGTAPNYKGQQILSLDMTTGKVQVVASVDFTQPGNTQGTLSDPVTDHGYLVWGQTETGEPPYPQHLYATDLATNQTRLLATHILDNYPYFHWPYVVYTNQDGKLVVHDMTTNATRLLPLPQFAAQFTKYSLTSSTLVASATEIADRGTHQLVVRSLDLTHPNAAWQPIITVPSSAHSGGVSLNDRLVVWTDVDANVVKAWDRAQGRIVVVASLAGTRGIGFCFLRDRWLVCVTPQTDSWVDMVTIFDTSKLPTRDR